MNSNTNSITGFEQTREGFYSQNPPSSFPLLSHYYGDQSGQTEAFYLPGACPRVCRRPPQPPLPQIPESILIETGRVCLCVRVSVSVCMSNAYPLIAPSWGAVLTSVSWLPLSPCNPFSMQQPDRLI